MIPEFTLKSFLRGNLLECNIHFEKAEDGLYELAYYLYCDGTRIKTFWYAPVRTFLCVLDQPGEYKVEAFIRLQGQESPVTVMRSNPVFKGNNLTPFMKAQSFMYGDSLEMSVLLPEHNSQDFLFAFRVYRNDTLIYEIWYSHKENMVFSVSETGEYYVECFVAKEVGFPFFFEKSDRFSYYTPADAALAPINNTPTNKWLKKILLGVPVEYLEDVSVNTQYMDRQLICEICGMRKQLYATYFVLLQNGKTVQSKISLNGHAKFTVQEHSSYLVKCLIRTISGCACLQRNIFQKEAVPVFKEEYQHVSLDAPPFAYSATPFIDFSVISISETLDDVVIARIETDGFKICRQTKFGNKNIYLLIPKDFNLENDVLLSGFVYERTFVYGQKFVDQLPMELLEEKNFAEMTGSFTAVKYQKDSVLVTTDLFGAGHLYVFEDETATIVSNRLHLTLLTMCALQIRPIIDVGYIASTLCYSERMISTTNFTTEMIFKGLKLLPLNQYMRLSAEGTDYRTKAMTYEQIPYQEDEYRRLLDLSYDDITQKVSALAESNLFDRYIQEVTGGFDSRVALAATLNNQKIVDKMRAKTIDVSTSKDLRCSLVQTNYYHLSYYAREEDPVKILPITLELKDFQNRSLAMGTYCSIGVDPFPFYLIDTSAVCFGGYFGETMRSRYFGVMQNSLSIEDTAADIVRKFMQRVANDIITADSKCQEQFAERLEKQIEQMPGHTAVEKFDNMYTFFHLRYHFGLSEYQSKISNMIRLAPYMSKHMLYASKMLSMQQRFQNKIMYEMAHWLKPEIISFPFSSYGLQDEKIQLDGHKQDLLLKEPDKLHIELDFDDHKYQSVAQSNIEFNRRCDEQLAKSEEGAEKRDVTRFAYLRILKILDMFEQQTELSSVPWNEIRNYVFCRRHDNSKLQPLYCKLMGIYDQLNIVLQLFD